jgi:hypothetical protein
VFKNEKIQPKENIENTCVNDVLSIAHKNYLWLILKLIKSTFLWNIKTL